MSNDITQITTYHREKKSKKRHIYVSLLLAITKKLISNQVGTHLNFCESSDKRLAKYPLSTVHTNIGPCSPTITIPRYYLEPMAMWKKCKEEGAKFDPKLASAPTFDRLLYSTHSRMSDKVLQEKREEKSIKQLQTSPLEIEWEEFWRMNLKEANSWIHG